MAEWRGMKVKLNSPSRIQKGEPGYGRKKFKVFVSSNGKVKKVMFGDPNMEIRKDNPKARASFRARHKCSTAKDKTSARYWSCKMWQVNMGAGTKHYFKTGKEYKGKVHKMNGQIHTGAKHSKSSKVVVHYGSLSKTAKSKARKSWK